MDGFLALGVTGGDTTAGGAPKLRNEGLSSFLSSQNTARMPANEIPINIKNVVTGYSRLTPSK